MPQHASPSEFLRVPGFGPDGQLLASPVFAGAQHEVVPADWHISDCSDQSESP